MHQEYIILTAPPHVVRSDVTLSDTVVEIVSLIAYLAGNQLGTINLPSGNPELTRARHLQTSLYRAERLAKQFT